MTTTKLQKAEEAENQGGSDENEGKLPGNMYSFISYGRLHQDTPELLLPSRTFRELMIQGMYSRDL